MIDDFIKFLKEKDLIKTLIGMIITLQLTSIMNALTNNILSPMINTLLLDNEKGTRLSEYKYKYNNVEYEIGVIIMVLIRAIILLSFAFYLHKSNII